jgi:hypothetical protein
MQVSPSPLPSSDGIPIASSGVMSSEATVTFSQSSPAGHPPVDVALPVPSAGHAGALQRLRAALPLDRKDASPHLR